MGLFCFSPLRYICSLALSLQKIYLIRHLSFLIFLNSAKYLSNCLLSSILISPSQTLSCAMIFFSFLLFSCAIYSVLLTLPLPRPSFLVSCNLYLLLLHDKLIFFSYLNPLFFIYSINFIIWTFRFYKYRDSLKVRLSYLYVFLISLV